MGFVSGFIIGGFTVFILMIFFCVVAVMKVQARLGERAAINDNASEMAEFVFKIDELVEYEKTMGGMADFKSVCGFLQDRSRYWSNKVRDEI